MTDLQRRLDELCAEHGVPGASLGLLADGEVEVHASGVINKGTGVEATTDTLFQIGSVSKSWTATLVMMLVDDGLLDLDEPVVSYVPEFRIADADVSRRVTLRQFLSHTSGIGGDHILETGRGDDNLERYVETCAELPKEYEPGRTMSYCNTGYSVAGRALEKVTGKTWDQVLRERIIQPLGLTHTNTLPEEAILFRTAVGHIKLPGATESTVAPFWVLPRSAGPAGLINATAADLLAFAKLHLDDGRAPDGTQLLSPASVKQMQESQIDVPDRWTLGDRWGLGWILFGWGGPQVIGHDGNTVGQSAFLRMVPDKGVAICLLTNGGTPSRGFRALCGEVLGELAGVEVPDLPTAPATPPDLDLDNYVGTYQRKNVEIGIRREPDGTLTAKPRTSGPLSEMIANRNDDDEEKNRIVLTPVDRALFLAKSPEADAEIPFVFFEFDGDTPRGVHYGARASWRV